MVRRQVRHCDPIIPNRQVTDNGRQNAVHRGEIQPPEKRKMFWVSRSRLVEPRQCINHDVRMAYDVPVRVDILGASHIRLLRIREPTGIDMSDRDLGGEVLAARDDVEIPRENELG